MIDVKTNERVVHLVINAPPVNVLDSKVLGELIAKLKEVASRDDVAAVVISGEGKCFSAGASVAEHKQEQAEAMLDTLLDACTVLADLPVPTVALVHGACLGGAMELIAFCDMVVADPDAKLGQPEIKLAFIPPVACYQLPRLAGLQNAAYAILTGATLSADEAARMGMVQKVLPRDDWELVDGWFNRLSAAALRVAKEGFMQGAGLYRRESLEELKKLFMERLYKLEDVAEGIASFEEKRKPEWKHR